MYGTTYLLTWLNVYFTIVTVSVGLHHTLVKRTENNNVVWGRKEKLRNEA